MAEQAVQLAPAATRLTVQPNAVLASRRLDFSKPLVAAGVPLPAAALIRQSAARSRVLFAEVGVPALADRSEPAATVRCARPGQPLHSGSAARRAR
ncbi:hypothetical protein EAS64_30345 [Trebonia kvetii]|uniref:Uncharacterized protein n=1 Tax=Trebonia kvetii TaxID=2480626 RepID=A0A6P2BRQ1_9ACTN|nr:hypothetical protein [Trebonia kvetii]TVZ01759.1 hypothetical protein EAS64_30345 [Trebonia kvetii]